MPAANPPEVAKSAITAAKAAQIMQLIKDNQFMTALCLFVLWQAGAFVSAYSYVQGGMC